MCTAAAAAARVRRVVTFAAASAHLSHLLFSGFAS